MQDETLSFILKELQKKYLIPFIIVDKKLNIIFPDKADRKNELMLSYIPYAHPNKISILEAKEFYFSIFQGGSFNCSGYYILVGPYFKEKLYDEFINFVKIIFSIINNRLPKDDQFVEIDCCKNTLSLNKRIKKNFELRVTYDKQLDSIELEKRLIQSIVQNDIRVFEWIFKQIPQTYFVQLHSNRLISLKYKYVALISILTRVSINNGVSSDSAYSLSDSLIQKLEYIETIPKCTVYLKESSLAFMQLINSTIQLEKNSLMKKIYHYIDSHINERISVNDIADYCQKHKSYLSSEFKKNTGDTIHKYINQRKIKEAKYLLLFTNLSSSTITMKLGFADQSHFIRIFKKLENMTPKEFREKFQSTKIL